MLGRGRIKSPKSSGEFRASIKSFYEEQLIRKRLANETAKYSSVLPDLSISQSELREIEQSTVNTLLSRLSVHKVRSDNTLNISLSPIIKSSESPILSLTKKSVHFEDYAKPKEESTIQHQPLFIQARADPLPTVITQQKQSESVILPSFEKVSESTQLRRRRPSKSETPESSKFSHWIKVNLNAYEDYLSKLKEFKSNPAILPICNQVRMAIQEVIDVYTSDDPNDIKNISAALILFQDLYKTGAAKKGNQPLPLTDQGRLFITFMICERYLKRVVNQDTCISFVATLLVVLTKNEPEIFNVLLAIILSKCVLPHLDTRKCLDHVVKLSNGPAEESAQWISEETARFKLLVQICVLTTPKNTETLKGLNLIHFLLNEAIRAPAIPISTPFVINTIFSVNLFNYNRRNSSEFANFLSKSKEICELDWPVIIRQTIEAADINFNDRAYTLVTAKNAVLIQNLRATLSSINI